MFQIHIALIAAVSIAAYLLFPEMKSYSIPVNNDDMLQYLIPIAFIVAVVGNLLFKSSFKEITENDYLSKKLNVYQTAMLVRLAFMDGIAFFSIFQLSENKNVIYLVVIALSILYMLFLAPTKTRIMKQLVLSEKDKRILQSV